MNWLRWFTQPWALILLGLLPIVSLLLAWARWRRRQALRQLGAPFLIERLVELRPRRRRWQALLLMAGLLALIVGGAGPRWGIDARTELLTGKDIVVVLDLSKSMLAEQPSRLERARRSLRDFADMLEARGGHRVALVAFAAHAKLFFPLTGDYDHFCFALDQADADELPPALRPQAGEKIASGTRIGAALRLAVAAHDVKRSGWQDIVLVSDGDDPAGDDEWTTGLNEARKFGIPIHVVAIGDPREAHPIRTGNDVLRHDGAVVQSKLNESLLQEIARRTSGIYFPAHLTALPLGKLLRGYLDSRRDAPNPEAESDADEVKLTQAEPRYLWFLLPALLLLGATMFINDGTAPKGRVRPAPVPRLALAGVAIAMISAEPLASVEDFVRQGNAAFERQQFEDALAWYLKAEPNTADPGLVAFNQAAALFRLGRFDEAAQHYERCLEDQLIPPIRLARGSYDLGTALLQGGSQERRLLEQAIAAFRRCLRASPAGDLRNDAQHNLELAKWLWIQAKPPSDTERANATDPAPGKPQPLDPRGNGDPQHMAKNSQGAADEGGTDKNGIEHPGLDGTKKKLAHGPLQVLPDDAKLTPLSPEDTTAYLEQFTDRMRRERRHYWQQTMPAPHVKDW